ncbi:MAG: P1 family peptidase [Actinomycetota bacterium]
MITSVSGIRVGHYTDIESITGCTVILCPEGTIAGVEIRGGAPGTRETDLLAPMNLVTEVHAILLTGGSAFGLGAADGMMRYLEEKGIGFKTGFGKVPIVPAAVIFDLNVGDPSVRPDPEAGYQACLNASTIVKEGSVGAGTGASIGKILGSKSWMKGGIGTASCNLYDQIVVGALTVVNAFGDVLDESGEILAGARSPEGGYLNTAESMKSHPIPKAFGRNTTLAVVATNVKMSKEEVNGIARMAHDGLARAINPVHTMYDGDIVFALATGEIEAEKDAVGVVAAELVSASIRCAVRKAKSIAGIPALT